MDSSNPYANLNSSAFWRSGVSRVSCDDLSFIYKKKFSLAKTDKVVTAGSCFAQHVAQRLKSEPIKVLDYEKAPASIPLHIQKQFSYSIYSARYGNIYTAIQLHELANEVFGISDPRFIAWKNTKGRYIDALRPSVEPNGFSSFDELCASRLHHLECVKKCFLDMDVFIFTLGLTEAWIDERTGFVLPSAPGVIAGNMVDNTAHFVNYTYSQVLQAMCSFLRLLNSCRTTKPPKIILTVSPVPLTATASGLHVLCANRLSKATLRLVAHSLYEEFSYIDYFPSFEILTHPKRHSLYFDWNDRSVSKFGVEAAMNCFLSEHFGDYANTSEVLELDSLDKLQTHSSMNRDLHESIACEEFMIDPE